MIEKIKQVLKNPKEVLTAASGLTLLALYYFYGRKELGFDVISPDAKNGLDMHLTDLVNKPKRKDIIKIALTESTKTKCELRRKIISVIKTQMIKHKLTTLVNCSPLKLLNSGCEYFIEGIDYNDPDDEDEIVSYLYNAIKCQLVIEQTIVDIQSIKKEDKNIFILCDTNSMDTKVRIEEPIWQRFLSQFEVNEEKIKDNYDLVFHVRDLKGIDPVVDEENDMIADNWKGYKNFYTINYDQDLDLEENVREGVKMVQMIMLSKLPPGFQWQKLQE